MKVLLTGAFGNIGKNVIDALLDKKHEIICFDLGNRSSRKTAKQYVNKVKIIWGDITDRALVEEAVSQAEVVIHNAAIIPPLSENIPEISQKVNVTGTQNIVEAIQKFGKNPQLIFPSSISVHGNHFPEDKPPRKINDPFKAEDHYAGHKIECEKMIDASKVRSTVFRIGACLGAELKVKVKGNVRQLTEMIFKISAKCRVEYVHPKDVALAMVNAIGNEEVLGKKLFLGGGKSCQEEWKDFCSTAFVCLGIGPIPENLFGSGGYYTEWMDTEESQRILNFQNHTLEDYRREMRHRFKWGRILLTPIRPLLRSYLFSFSPNR